MLLFGIDCCSVCSKNVVIVQLASANKRIMLSSRGVEFLRRKWWTGWENIPSLLMGSVDRSLVAVEYLCFHHLFSKISLNLSKDFLGASSCLFLPIIFDQLALLVKWNELGLSLSHLCRHAWDLKSWRRASRNWRNTCHSIPVVQCETHLDAPGTKNFLPLEEGQEKSCMLQSKIHLWCKFSIQKGINEAFIIPWSQFFLNLPKRFMSCFCLLGSEFCH